MLSSKASPGHPETGRGPAGGFTRRQARGRAFRRAYEIVRSHWIPAADPKTLEVFVDITNRCNLRCIMCHFSYDHVRRRPAHHMDPELFRTIASQLRPHTHKLTLSAACEPTVSPHFTEILKISGELGFPEIGFLTNGNRLTDPIITSILDSGVTRVAISVHGADPATYASIHRGGSLERVVGHVSRLIRARGRPALGKPTIGFHVTLMRRNIEELPRIVRLASELGLDFVSMRHLVSFQGLGLETELLSDVPDEANVCIQRALELAHREGVAVPTCPDYFATTAADSRAQDAWFLQEPPAGEEPFTLTKRPITFAERLPALLPFFYRQRRVLPALLRQSIRGNPVGSVTGLARTLDGKGLVIQGWAVSREGLGRVRLVRSSSDCRSRLPTILRESEVLAEGWFHNGADPSVQAILRHFPLTYRTCWSIELSPQDSRLQSQDLLRIEVLTRDGASRPIVEFRLILTPAEFAPICTKPFTSLYTDHLGQVYPHPDCRTPVPFGSFAHQSFAEIWNGTPLSDTRMALTEGRPPSMCGTCPLYANRNVGVADYWKARPHLDRTEIETGKADPPRPG